MAITKLLDGVMLLRGPLPTETSGGEDLHPMQLSNHVVKGYGWTTTSQPAGVVRALPRSVTV